MINLDESIEKVLNNRASRQISADFGLGIDLDKLVYTASNQKSEEVWKSPIELVEKSESNKFLTLPKNNSLSLQSKQLYNKLELPLHNENELKLITLYNITQSLDSTKVTAISASKHLIALGYSTGKLVLFNYSGTIQQDSKLTKTPDALTSLEISQQEGFLLSSHESGSIFIYNIKTSKVQKHIKLHYSPVLCLKFWNPSEDYFLSGDLTGKCFFSALSKKLGKGSNSNFSLVNGELGGIVCIAPFHKPSEVVCKYSSLVCICGKDKACIFSIEPSIETVFVVDNNQEVHTLCYPNGYWVVRNQKIYFLLVWDNSLSVFLYENTGFEVFVRIKVIDLDSEVYKIDLINEEFLAGVGKNNIFWMKIGKLIQNDNVNVNRKIRTCKITPQNLLKVNNANIPIYQNSVFTNKLGIFYVSGNSIYHLKLLDWETCLDELRDRCDWLTCFSLGLNFYKGKYKKSFKLRSQDQIKQKLLNLLKVYALDTFIPLKYRIWNCLEVCIFINSFDLLNVELYEYFLTEGRSESIEHFINAIEYFTLSDGLKSVSEIFMNKMVEFYQDNGKLDVLENIFMHFDPLQVNTTAIQGICEMLLLTSAYSFMSTCCSQPNFVSPLKILFKSIHIKEDLKQKLVEFYKMNWYIKVISCKKCINGAEIPDELYISIINNVKNWVKKTKYLLVLLQIDASVMLSSLYDLFTIPNSSDSTQISVNDLVLTLFSLFPESSTIYTQICLFTVNIFIVIKETLDSKFHLSILKHLLRHVQPNTPKIQAFDLYHYISQYTNNSKRPIYGSFTLEQLDRILTKSLKKLKISEEDLEEILRINSFLPYTRLMIYLCELKNDYQNCFIYYTKSTIQKTKLKIFKWVKKVSNQLQNPQIFLNLLENFLPELGIIDAEKTLKLVQEYFAKQFWTVFKACRNSEKLRFLMIRSVKNKMIPEELIPDYTQLLFVFDKEQLLGYLMSLPSFTSVEVLEKCEQVCRTHHNLDATCYLLVLQNKIFTALEVIYLEMKIFQSKFMNNNIPKQSDIKAYSKFILKIHEICDGNLDDLQIKEAKGIFTSLLHLILDFYQSHSALYSSELQNLTKIFITSALHYINFEFLLQKTSEKSKSIPMTIFKSALLTLFTKRTFYHKSLKTFKKILDSELSEKTEKSYKAFQIGTITSTTCKICQKPIQSKQKVKIFPCGHSFHSTCLQNPKCPNHKN